MKWFGQAYGAPYEADCEQVATPVGDACAWCDELIADSDAGVILPLVGHATKAQVPYHYECQVRMIVGGVNHQLHLCHCPGCAGVLAPDPAGLSRREAAMAAVMMFEQRPIKGRE